MTAKELAIELNGRDTGEEMEWGEIQDAKAAGLVVVYGYSDDNVELCGAINDEVGAYEDTTIYLTKDGLLEEPACNDAENCTCPYFETAKKAAKTITAIWRDGERPSRVFSTDIPHETFTVMEDGEPFCVGIVFSMEALKEVADHGEK